MQTNYNQTTLKSTVKPKLTKSATTQNHSKYNKLPKITKPKHPQVTKHQNNQTQNTNQNDNKSQKASKFPQNCVLYQPQTSP